MYNLTFRLCQCFVLYSFITSICVCTTQNCRSRKWDTLISLSALWQLVGKSFASLRIFQLINCVSELFLKDILNPQCPKRTCATRCRHFCVWLLVSLWLTHTVLPVFQELSWKGNNHCSSCTTTSHFQRSVKDGYHWLGTSAPKCL